MLCVLLAGLTLVFVGFSILIILSSATVVSNKSDFNVGVYSFKYSDTYEGYIGGNNLTIIRIDRPLLLSLMILILLQFYWHNKLMIETNFCY